MRSATSFAAIAASMSPSTNVLAPVSVTQAPQVAPAKPKKHAITVLVTMPHVKKYGQNPTMQLTYA